MDDDDSPAGTEVHWLRAASVGNEFKKPRQPPRMIRDVNGQMLPLVPLGDVDVEDVWSDDVHDTFRLFIGHCGTAPEATLVVTDANGLFGLVLDTVRLMQIYALMPSLLIVGIGYPDASILEDTVHVRARDLTPTARPDFENSGGGPSFLQFIRDRALPRFATHRSNSLPSIYFGHSLGGLFGVQALLSEARTFDHHIISSPSLWWNRDWLVETERRHMERGQLLRGAVFFGIGGDETDAGRRREAARLPDGHWQKPPPMRLDMVEDMTRFVDVLERRSDPGLELASVVFPGEYHSTTPAMTLTRGLRHIFEPR